jgi:hypothetical protein
MGIATQGRFDGTDVVNVVDDNTTGGFLLVHRISLPSGANANTDVTLDHKERVLDATIVLSGAGTTGSTVTIQNAANAISDVIDVASGGDRDAFRPGEINDANHEINAAGTLRVATASTGGDFPGAECYVYVIRVA